MHARRITIMVIITMIMDTIIMLTITTIMPVTFMTSIAAIPMVPNRANSPDPAAGRGA